MRTAPFRKIAIAMRDDSKFFIGKNKVAKVALGHAPEDEYADNTHKLGQYLTGHVCLLATNKTKEQVEAALKKEEIDDFATAGTEATYTVFLGKGTESLDGYPHSLESYLKQLGLPIKLNF